MLKLKNKILLAYAIDFSAFLTERIDMESIKRIILFGSAARGEASKDSDVDLFIDITRDKNNIKKNIKKIKEQFIKSKIYQNYWLLKNVKNEIKPIIGKLEEWGELKNSIISNGIVLYGKFEEIPEKGLHKTLLFWENIKPESKRVLLSKRLFGYKKEKKQYEGLVKKYNAERLGKGMILVLSESANIFLKLFRKMKIKVKIKKVLEY